MPTLVLTPRFTADAQALWRAASQLGWNVERLSRWEVPDELRSIPDPVLYLEGLFGPTLAERFGRKLLEPDIDWMPSLPEEYRKRHIYRTTVGLARRTLNEPAFVKPPNDKSFPAQIALGTALPTDIDDDMPVLVSEVVVWEKEFRCFVLDREPMTISIYFRGGEFQRDTGFVQNEHETSQALSFLKNLLDDSRIELPRAAVIDVGIIKDRGWAVVEQNAAWASGIYGCDPVCVLEVLRHASVSLSLSIERAHE